MGLDLVLLTGGLGTDVTQGWTTDDWDWIEILDPLLINVHLLSQTFLGLKIDQHLVIIWSI